ncbi:hypothetical protein Mgra_00010037 [Meloidogyne graminicola]|uniref:Uncharacterized protein n=1 Tax=Meloidogyne graminicola TaxID=189291 RepID=A0A8S9Z6A0_9BILA|nr:hypothetical protein Mgra_00010037 [Meloidogyne graminicola]
MLRLLHPNQLKLQLLLWKKPLTRLLLKKSTNIDENIMKEQKEVREEKQVDKTPRPEQDTVCETTGGAIKKTTSSTSIFTIETILTPGTKRRLVTEDVSEAWLKKRRLDPEVVKPPSDLPNENPQTEEKKSEEDVKHYVVKIPMDISVKLSEHPGTSASAPVEAPAVVEAPAPTVQEATETSSLEKSTNENDNVMAEESQKTKEDVINLLKEINQVLSPFHEKDELKMLKSNAYALINTLDVAHAQLIYLIKYFCSASFEKKILEINWREEKAYHYATTEAVHKIFILKFYFKIQTGLKIKIDIFVNLIKYLMEKLEMMDFIKGITDIHGLALGILVALKFGFKSEEKGK